MSNKTRDTASVNFEKDEWLQLLTLKEEGNQFGVVLIANWPTPEQTMNPYREILPSIKSCFNESDYEIQENGIPCVYLYPANALHITLATFTPFPETNSIPDKETYAMVCQKVVNNAFNRQDWPNNQNIEIEIDRAQIGVKAGIFLWKNKDGMIQTMRDILQQEYDKVFQQDPQSLNHRKFIIPGIIHSTFLRFGQVPETDGGVVQKRFSEIQDLIKKRFGTLKVNSVRLAIERTPYMHIPCNDRHVLASFEF